MNRNQEKHFEAWANAFYGLKPRKKNFIERLFGIFTINSKKNETHKERKSKLL
ncbi:hypothetical protein HNQ88_003004 [Aureibacter tunicatorum]|uniref:Uncharacterized protein n=1 Tax=Aureibacter tunicatorum TaxID=866807 RepID=A0AAE3XQA0_9BACT|nr:hypothetical protein [Aureibacter tunicatorum]BDD04429.1 hypothetical protein AUTU_19120 [Aureibacter tunicatorum]